MNPEKTITIFGKEVKMLYCAGSETSFETLSDHKVTVFFPTISEYDENGNPSKINQPEATKGDEVYLGIGCIIAAYGANNQEPPVSPTEILFKANAEDVKTIREAAIELLQKWYKIPSVIQPETNENAEGESKNALEPATDTNLS